MKYVFIINSYTINNIEEVCNKIINYCKNKKIDYVIEINYEKSTENILEKYMNTKNIIIAVGGDGLINRIINKIVNTNNILGIIPYGTGNDLYKSIKEQFREEYNKCDIVKINNKYFINTACFGIDADVANNKDLIKTKFIPKKQKYNIGLIYSFFKYKCRNLEIKVNNRILKDEYTTIAVCNGKYYGGGFMIAPSSKLFDGLLDVYIAKKLNKISMLNLILKLKKGKHENDNNIEKIMTDKIIIKSKDKIKCNIDGEILEDNIFEIKIIKEGITLYYNQELIDEIIKK